MRMSAWSAAVLLVVSICAVGFILLCVHRWRSGACAERLLHRVIASSSTLVPRREGHEMGSADARWCDNDAKGEDAAEPQHEPTIQPADDAGARMVKQATRAVRWEELGPREHGRLHGPRPGSERLSLATVDDMD